VDITHSNLILAFPVADRLVRSISGGWGRH